MDILDRAPKCTIFGPQNLGPEGGGGRSLVPRGSTSGTVLTV